MTEVGKSKLELLAIFIFTYAFSFLFSYIYISTEIHLCNECINKHVYMGCLLKNIVVVGVHSQSHGLSLAQLPLICDSNTVVPKPVHLKDTAHGMGHTLLRLLRGQSKRWMGIITTRGLSTAAQNF